MFVPARKALLTALVCLSLAPGARADEFTPAQKSEIEKIVRSYLLEHPEVLRDVSLELEKRQQAEEASQRQAAIDKYRAALFDNSFHGVVGNAQGSVAMAEFFDYNCGYCKRAFSDLTGLIKANPNLKVVLIDFPVLGADSVEAAAVAAAVRKQLSGDKFLAFHQKLLTGFHGRVGREQALSVAKELGVDMAKLDADLKNPDVRAGLEQTMKIADALNLTGTPSYIIGNEAIVGAVGAQQLQGLLTAMTKCGKTAC